MYAQSRSFFIFSTVRHVAQHTSTVGREALLDVAGVLTLGDLNTGKPASSFEAERKQERRDDGGEKRKAEDYDGKGRVRHDGRT